jgi:hypothetical protein
MMQLSCQYCGKKLTAKEEWLGKRGKCPACNHTFFIPDMARVREEMSAEEERRRMAAYWAGKSDEEIAQSLLNGHAGEALHHEGKGAQDEERAALIKKRQEEYWAHKSDEEIVEILLEGGEEAEVTRPFFFPRYDDLTLFTLSVTLLFLLMTNGQLQNSLVTFLTSGYQHLGFYVLLAMWAGGMVLSMVTVFFDRRKSDFEKHLLLIFAVGITAGTGIYAGILMFESFRSWLLIFPIWNILSGVILILYFRTGVVTTKCISDEHASFVDIVTSLIAMTILLAVCQYVFKLHWVYTYSIAVCYTMSLHSVLQDFFPKIMRN